MKKFLIVLLCLPWNIYAQNLPFESGARSVGVANSAMAISQVWSVNNNQAALAFLKNPEIGVFYTNRFLLKELGSQSLAFAYPTKLGALGVSLDYFGYDQQSELQVGLAYAKKLNEYFSLGVKFNYLQYQQLEFYGNTRAIVVEVGLLSRPYEKLIVGFQVYNPTRSKFNTDIEKYAPTILNFGAAYVPSSKLLLSAQVSKNIDYPMIYKMGIEFEIKESLFLRTGFNIQPNAYFMGIGFDFKTIRFNLAFSYQDRLGISPASSLSYEFK